MPLYRYNPDYCVAPGATLAEWMHDHGHTASSLATACARMLTVSKPCALDRIKLVLTKRELTPDIARMLADGTGIPAKMWLALEHNYRAGLKAGLVDAT